MPITQFDLIDETYAGPYGRDRMAGFLQCHGRRMHGAALPANVRPGRPKMCFLNAWCLTISQGFQYFEGHAWDPKIGTIPFHHAWCYDLERGQVVDPTWHDADDAVYLGVHVPTPVLIHIQNDRNTFGILDRGRGFEAAVVEKYFGYRHP